VPPSANIRAVAWRVLRCAAPLAVIVLLTTWPWRFQDHAHWDGVEWVPFTRYVRARDWIANIGLFIPLGAAYAWRGQGRRLIWQAAIAGLACSLAVELAQVFMHGRAPTVADLIANTAGAWLGARWAIGRSRSGTNASEPGPEPAAAGSPGGPVR
jgi:glycopeptide antibiotics resistance protein